MTTGITVRQPRPSGGGSRGWQPGERWAPPQAFIQGLARHPQQARGYALIARSVPQGCGN